MKRSSINVSFTVAFCASVSALSGAALAGRQDEICQSPLLPYTQRNLCIEQIAKADTKTERAQVQAKFRDRVKAAEDAAKEEADKAKK